MRLSRALSGLFLCVVGASCYRLQPPQGGGEAKVRPARPLNASDVALLQGYRIEVVADGFTYPTGVAFDDAGTPHVVEAGYSYGESFTEPRLLRVEKDGRKTEIAKGEHPPWTGATWAKGAFFVAEGGEIGGGRIVRIEKDGTKRTLVEGIPSKGDHHTNGPALGPDGKIYFAVGPATNSGVVGIDNWKFGWLKRHPDFHDVPCKDLEVTDASYTTPNPLTEAEDDQATTSPYAPFGKALGARTVPGELPCNGAVLKVSPDGGPLEVVAWGLRNVFGLAFDADGTLYGSENGYDVRGSRPVWAAGDVLWKIEPGLWYGFPDYSAGRPLFQDDRFAKPGDARPKQVVAKIPNEPPKPLALLAAHSSSNGLDVSRNAVFGFAGHVFVAQFGDMVPETGKTMAPVGYKVVRVDPKDGTIHPFAVNHGDQNGPASLLGNGGLERPVAARFDPSGTALYVVDFGQMKVTEKGPNPVKGTGVLWRITKVGS